MRIVKYLVIGAVGLLVLAVAAVAIFVATFDPNKYKTQIEAAVKEQTGRTLKLEGDLKVAVFPSLGAEVAKVTLSERNPAQEFVSLDSAHGSVALMPLLRGEVVVDRIRISGLKANVVKDKDGISAALAVALLAAELKADGRTLLDRLDELAVEHGLFVTGQLSARVEDLTLISDAMARLRAAPPSTLLGREVAFTDLLTEEPAVDGVRLLGDGVRVIVRPSGTEPKLKAYLETVVPVHEDAGLIAARGRGADELDALRAEMSAALGL